VRRLLPVCNQAWKREVAVLSKVVCRTVTRYVMVLRETRIVSGQSWSDVNRRGRPALHARPQGKATRHQLCSLARNLVKLSRLKRFMVFTFFFFFETPSPSQQLDILKHGLAISPFFKAALCAVSSDIPLYSRPLQDLPIPL
jgi:hypothetical protein